MAARLAAAWIEREFSGREDILLRPGAGGRGIFPAESEGEMDRAPAAGEVVLMELADSGEMGLERLFEPRRQKGDPLAHAFAFADGDLVIIEIDIFDAEAEGLEQTQAAPVEEMNHEAVIAFEMGEDGARLGAGEHDGEFSRAAHAFHAGDEIQFPIEHLPIEEKESAEGLILSGGGNGAINGEVTEEGGDFHFAHGVGMTFVMEKDEAADPIQVSLLRADAVVLQAKMPADAIEQPGRRRAGEDRWRGGCDHDEPGREIT